MKCKRVRQTINENKTSKSLRNIVGVMELTESAQFMRENTRVHGNTEIRLSRVQQKLDLKTEFS